MTQDEIADIYQKANGWNPRAYPNTMAELEAFAKLVAAKEREEIADELEHGYIDDEGHHIQYANEIRARGEA